MKITLMILALFSFMHEERYEAQDYQCEANQIKIKYDDTWFDVNLFNLFINEEVDICPYVEGEVTFEFDSYVKIEDPINVYLFVNDELLQQTLIDDQQAIMKIEHPKYKYQLEKKEEAVIKTVEDEQEGTSYHLQNRVIAQGLIFIWISIVLTLLYRKYKNSTKDKDEDIS